MDSFAPLVAKIIKTDRWYFDLIESGKETWVGRRLTNALLQDCVNFVDYILWATLYLKQEFKWRSSAFYYFKQSTAFYIMVNTDLWKSMDKYHLLYFVVNFPGNH